VGTDMTMAKGSPGGFGIKVSFTAERAVLGVQGELDLVTAPELAAMLAAVIDRGHGAVVLDLAELDFMGVAGLRIIEAGAGRLESLGGRLTVRGPSDLVRRMIDIAGLAALVTIELAEHAHDHLGPEQTAAAPGAPVTVDPASLAHQLRRITAIPADEDVVDGALRLVVALARATVSGADGVSVSLNRHGQLSTVAASDQTILDMDADQYATGEGPCVDASVEGRWFHAESLDQETRWPAFTPKARMLGIKAILSTPLLAEERPVGALNIYSKRSAAFAAEQQALASIFATEASVILRQAGADVSEDQLSGRLAEALRSRQVIAQAQGVLMEREGIGEDEAYARLRQHSRKTDRPLRARAAEIVGSTRSDTGIQETGAGAAPWLAS